MLTLDKIRHEFATYLASHSDARFSMDKALAHVVEFAYQQGFNEGYNTGVADANTDNK